MRFRCYRNELNVSHEHIESGMEFQIVGTAAWKQREPKVRLVRGQQRKTTSEHGKDGKEQGDERGRWGVSIHILESKRSKLKLDAPLN